MSKSHIHQYKKVKLSKKGSPVYRCMLSDCPHYILPAFILGKTSLCPSCGSTFTIDKYASQRTFPVCEDCRKTKDSTANSSPSTVTSDTALAEILKKLGV